MTLLIYYGAYAFFNQTRVDDCYAIMKRVPTVTSFK